jgi:hypothetical protein
MESGLVWLRVGMIACAGVLAYKAYRPPVRPKVLWKTGGAGTPFSRRTYGVFAMIVLSAAFVDTTSKAFFLLSVAAFLATAIADVRNAERARESSADE